MATLNPPFAGKQQSHFSRFVKNSYPFWLLLPALFTLVAVQVYPTLYSVYISMNKVKGGKYIWIGLKNYIGLINSSDFWLALEKTAIFSGSYLVLVIVMAMCIAILLNQRTLLTPLYVTLLFIPWVLSDTVSGTMWRWLFNQDYGIIQVALNPLINNTSLLSNDSGAMFIVVISAVWRSLAFTSLLFLSALQTVSNEIKEAASLDGASPWQSFWRITLPIIRPTLLVVILMTSIGGINQLGLILATTAGGPGTATSTASILLYREAWKYGDFGTAASLAVILFFINLGLTLVYFRILKVEA